MTHSDEEIRGLEVAERLLGDPDVLELVAAVVADRPTRIGKSTAAAIARDVVSTLRETTAGRRVAVARRAASDAAADWDRHRDCREAEKIAALARFHRWSGRMGVDFYRTPAAERVEEATHDVRNWRRADHQRMQDHELSMLAVRVIADVFASQIGAAAGTGQDPDTIAWVLAGLRCPSQPFCTGCSSCQTVTAPNRPAGEKTSALRR